jgi:hypothetical protein
MARAYGVFALLLWGCAKPDVEIRALPDGARELTCKHTLPQCLSHVDEVCKGASYEVLYATDTQKIYGSPSSSEVESRTSQAVVHCLGPHQKPMDDKAAAAALVASSVAGAPGTASAPVAPPPPAAGAPPRACVPGATQACVGPAACSGGQACLPDGSGFGACDCGGAKPAL